MKVKFLDPYGFDDNSNFSSLENEVRAAHEDLGVKTNQNAQGVANNASNLATSVKNLAANLTNVQNNLYENITGVQTSLDSKIETVRVTADSAKQIADTSYGNAKYNRELIDAINNEKIPQLATKEDARKDADDAVAKVIANAPEKFDTLKEIADWIGKDETNTADIVTQVDAKQDKSEFQSYTAATEEKINSKADKKHTHVLTDITDYVAPDLTSYALKADVDDSEKVINGGLSELKNTYEADKATFATKADIKALQDAVAKLQETVSNLTKPSNSSN